MDFNEFKVLVKGMKAVYTSERFLPDADSVKIWFQMLGDLDYRTASAGIQKYILTNKFPPTIADIREICADVQNGEIEDWGDGWEKVLKAIRYFGSYRETEALETLDDLTRQCVVRLGFRNLCLSENITADRANFRIMYENLAERQKKASQIPVALSNSIEALRLTDGTKILEMKIQECLTNQEKLK